ncbi:hypothetical protein D3C72_1079740 [compost metagenome]
MLVAGQVGLHAVQEQRHFVEQAFGRTRALDDDALGVAAQALLFCAAEGTAGVDDDRREADVIVARHVLKQVVATAVGQVQVHHHAVEGDRAQLFHRCGKRADSGDLQLIAAQQQLQVAAQVVVVFHDQQAPHVALAGLFKLLDGSHQPLARGRLDRETDRAQLARHLAAVHAGDHVHRNVPGIGIALESFKHGQTGDVRQADVQQDAVRAQFRRQRQRLFGSGGYHAVEIELVRQRHQRFGEDRIIFHGQDQPPCVVAPATVIGHRCDRRCTGSLGRCCRCHRRDGGPLHGHGHCGFCSGLGHRRALQGQLKNEAAAAAWLAVHLDVTAHAYRKVTRDRQAQAGAAVTAAGAAISLAEGFEDQLQLVACDADAAVGDLESDPAIAAAANVQADLAVLGELDRIGQQVLQDLLQALVVGHQLTGGQAIGLDLQRQAFLPRHRLEGLTQPLQHAVDHHHFVGQFDVPCLDARQIEDVVDQRQQVVVG